MIAVRCIALLATFTILTVSSAGAASDELARAKDLYRTAAYDEALLALEEIAGESSGTIRTEANEYRLFCLIALDRKLDARVIIEAMVNADPFYQMTTAQASPRVRVMFKDIRQTLLPGLVQREYAAAKSAFDKQEAEATIQFDRVLKLLEDPQLTPNPSFADLKTVAIGFRDLSRARMKKVEPPAPAETPVATQSASINNTPLTASPAIGPAAPPAQSASAPAAYREGDPDVIPPVTLRQTVPQWMVPQGTRPGAWQPEAALELTIDESGNVASVQLRKSFHPSYDPLLLKAAESWKYQPARRAGVPVRYVKHVIVRLGGTN